MTNQLKSTDELELLQAASNPATTPEQLVEIANYLSLVSDPDFERPSSGTDFLRFIGRQGPLSVVLERPVRSPIVAALVANPNTPRKTLLHFAADFPEEFLANPALLLLLLEHPDLFRPMDELRLLVFLRNAHIPADLLRTIRTYATPAVLDALQLHISLCGEAETDWAKQAPQHLQELTLPSIDTQQLLIEHLALGTLPPWMEDLVRHSTQEHIQAALHNAETVMEEESIPALAYDINNDAFDAATITQAERETRKRAAESQHAHILRLLAEDDDPSVRARVACNINTPLDVMPLLELDDVQPVRAALAANPHTPVELLENMARDYSWTALRIRKAIARHPHVTPQILERLATDESMQVRYEVAHNPKTSAVARRQLLDRALTIAMYSIEPFFNVVAQANQYTDPQHLAKGVRSPFWQARYVLALNPATPLEAVHTLADDGNRYVRAAAHHVLKNHVQGEGHESI